MVVEDINNEVLEYLKKEDSVNTFRLARELNLDRSKLLKVIQKLEEKGAVEFKYGSVKFLKFPPGEKRIVSKPEIESKIKEPEQKVKAPKLIRRTIVKKVPVIKRVYVKSKKLEEQAEQIAKLEETIKELKKKASAHPKTITRTLTKTIIKKVPVTRTVIKRIPVTRTVVKKIPAPSPLSKFKFPKFTFMKNIKKLKKPKFVK